MQGVGRSGDILMIDDGTNLDGINMAYRYQEKFVGRCAALPGSGNVGALVRSSDIQLKCGNQG